MIADTKWKCGSFLCTAIILAVCVIHFVTPSPTEQTTLYEMALVAAAKAGTGLSMSNSTSLAKSIVRGLTRKGISDNDCATCKKRSEEYLIQQFGRWTLLNCLHLQKMLLPGSEDSTPAYILTGDTRCIDRQSYDDACFTSTSSQCSWNQTLEALTESDGVSTFPQYAVNLTCQGCPSAYDNACLVQRGMCYYSEKRVDFYVLKRSEQCGQDGYEEWLPLNTRKQLTVGCSCNRSPTT